MGIIVQKFGGSSLATTENLFHVCKHVTKEYDKGNQVVVVVSAQGKTTDRLIKEEAEITEKPNKREHDVLVSTGEQISIAKLCMCLNKLGYDAISLAGWQVPIVTDEFHGCARIQELNGSRVNRELEDGKIVVIAGFQGVDMAGDITTFGRGGSDTTAVAIAASLEAERCDIYTDVDGVYSSDPRIINNVIKIQSISYDEMLELASLGAKVLHNRCVELGKKKGVPIFVKSSFKEESEGTLVTEKDENMEALSISGVAKEGDVSRITLIGNENQIGRTYQVFKLLADNKINVDTIAQSFGEHICKDISFTVKTEELPKALSLLERHIKDLQVKEIKHCSNLSKISVIGVGIVNNPGVAAGIFEALYENNINMHMITTSEIKISVLVNKKEADIATRAIHDKFIK